LNQLFVKEIKNINLVMENKMTYIVVFNISFYTFFIQNTNITAKTGNEVVENYKIYNKEIINYNFYKYQKFFYAKL